MQRATKNVKGIYDRTTESSEQPTLVVHTKPGVQNLPGLIGKCYAEIAAYPGKLGEVPADGPFVAYYNTDKQNLNVETGFPISSKPPEGATSFTDRFLKGCTFSLSLWVFMPRWNRCAARWPNG